MGQVLETPVHPESGVSISTCLFISRKVVMDLISLTHRFVIKCQILSEAVHISHHCCFSESRIIAILGNCPTASCFYQHSSACLSPLTSLFTARGTFVKLAALQGTLSPGIALHRLPQSGQAWPWESKAVGGPSLRPGWLVPSNLKPFGGCQALRAGFEHAGALAAPQPDSRVLWGRGELSPLT